MTDYNLGFYINRDTNRLEFYKVQPINTDTINEFKLQPIEDSTVLILDIPVGRMFFEEEITESISRLILNANDIKNSCVSALEYLNYVLLIAISNNNFSLMSQQVLNAKNITQWYYKVVAESQLIYEEGY